MQVNFRNLLVLYVAFHFTLAPGCTLKHAVQPVKDGLIAPGPQKITIIRDNAVRFAGFHDSIVKALVGCGFTVESVPQGTAYGKLPLAITYTANWSWDLDLYLSYAHIQLFQDGKVIGDGLYDATWGGLNLGKWIHADIEVQKLVYDMFPTRVYKKEP